MLKGRFEYPLSVSRGRYVTEVGGRSDALKKGQIGLHAEALSSNTDLERGDDVLVDPVGSSSGGQSVPTPLFERDAYRVKALTDMNDTRLLAMSSDGEAVFSSEDPIEVREGEEVVLNSTVNNLPRDWVLKIIKDKLRNT